MFIPIKYYCVEATALSVPVNHYPLRQKGSGIGYFDVDSTVVYSFNVYSMDSLLYNISQWTDLVCLCGSSLSYSNKELEQT